MNRSLPVLASALSLLLVCAATASAQFTTFVPRPGTVEAAAEPAKPTGPSARDTLKATTLTDMRKWVDSAAGSIGQGAPVDTTTRAPRPSSPPIADESPRSTQKFEEGAPAPNTATPLPLLIVAGVGLSAMGLLLLRRRA